MKLIVGIIMAFLLIGTASAELIDGNFVYRESFGNAKIVSYTPFSGTYEPDDDGVLGIFPTYEAIVWGNCKVIS